VTDPRSALVPGAPPRVSAARAAEIARADFGVDGSAHSLGSNQDLNFVVTVPGEPDRLLKIANPSTTAAELEAQSRAALRLAEHVRVPVAVTDPDGSTVRSIDVDGAIVRARLLDCLEGRTLSGSGPLSRRTIAGIGRLAADVDVTLADFADAGAVRTTQWDLRHAPDVIAELLHHVGDQKLRARLQQASAEAWAAVEPLGAVLPVQVIHGDLTDDNVVVSDPLSAEPDGVIDLGDLNASWRVGELAITLSSLLHHDGVGLADAVVAVGAYTAALPLESAELAALWPLVVLRGAVLVASAHGVLARDPGNAYAAENRVHERAIFDAATSVPLRVGTALVQQAAGAGVEELSLPSHGALLDVPAGGVTMLDLSASSPLLHEGRWLVDDAETALTLAALERGAGVVGTRFAEPRLTRSRPGQDEPLNVILGIELTARAPIELLAPWAGRAVSHPEGIDLVAERGLRLRLRWASAVQDARAGFRTEETIARGATLGTLTGTVLVTVDDGTDLPAAVVPSLAEAWRAVAADPAALIPGAAPAPRPPDPADLRARRDAPLASVQEHYFADPPLMVRGWREYLVDADARVYIDALNNVTSIGHAHPRLVDAVTEQWRLLNTNSRFHYPAIVEFAERLAALLPERLEEVFLMNSGSEAVDLALRLARAHTGRRDILAVREAYHGWTDLTDAVSTSIADNPNALATRPDWVHTVDAPNSFRGTHADDPARYARDAVAEVERLAAAGTPPGAFVAETLYGNAGGIALPDGYLDAVYSAVRAHGGVAVADEVQVGYGRLGEWFWGFEQQGVVPDIVAVAKAMGNGHPLGAVITTREIAESYRTQGYFFSSAGGSPVSSAVGLAVLDVIRDEQLQRNAREVGAYLKARLEELGARHPLLGTVHGYGFYLGPEFVRDRTTLEPATEETAAICERMRRLGVMIQPTGDHQNVLKIKPPLCFTRESADAFVAALERVLSTGW
jgi:4-aminobutyrate aminotransferase-like enzyme/Ser/Thr protein kinase RdoA (MazF antagonist)